MILISHFSKHSWPVQICTRHIFHEFTTYNAVCFLFFNYWLVARLFHQAFISFRKYILEMETLSADLHIILSDICYGAGEYWDTAYGFNCDINTLQGKSVGIMLCAHQNCFFQDTSMIFSHTLWGTPNRSFPCWTAWMTCARLVICVSQWTGRESCKLQFVRNFPTQGKWTLLSKKSSKSIHA